MKNFLSKLIQSKSGAFKDFADLEVKITAVGNRRTFYHELDQKYTAAILAAQAEFNQSPSLQSLEKLSIAISTKKAFVLNDLFGKIEQGVYGEQDTLKKCSSSVQIYRRCLEVILEGLKSELQIAKTKWRTAFDEAGDTSADLSTIPEVTRLNFQVEDITQGIARLEMPVILTDPDWMRFAAICRGHLPGPPAPVVAPPSSQEQEKARILALFKGKTVAPAQAAENRQSLLPESWVGRHRPTGYGGQSVRVEVQTPNAVTE
jgi:hypothetical protein